MNNCSFLGAGSQSAHEAYGGNMTKGIYDGEIQRCSCPLDRRVMESETQESEMPFPGLHSKVAVEWRIEF